MSLNRQFREIKFPANTVFLRDREIKDSRNVPRKLSRNLSPAKIKKNKVHGNFHVPRNETHFKVHGNFHVPCLMMCCERYMEISMYLAICFVKEKLAEVT